MFLHLRQPGIAQFGFAQLVAFAEIGLCWFIWWLAFIGPRREAAGQKEITHASASRLGIFFNFLGFACIFAYIRPVGYTKTLPELAAGMLLAPLGVNLAWRATRHLGKQWRFQAAISQGHQLITTGPYARLRHPIYASILLMEVSTGLVYTWWPLLVAGVVISLIGFEIRIHAEDRLLEQYFQDEFLEWRGRTKAYIPFIR